MTSELVSVIVLCYGRWELTAAFLDSFFTWLDYPAELIILDNGSPDDGETWRELQRVSEGWRHLWLKDFQILHVDENLGVPGGWNYCIRHSRGDYICLINNDMVIKGPILTPMLVTLKEDPKCGCTGMQHMVWSGIPFVEGSLWMFPRKVWEDVGEFDEAYFPGSSEDVDWQIRMREKGWIEKPTFGMDVFHHKHQSRAGVLGPLEERRNKLYLCGKFGLPLDRVE